ncbi:secretion protein HlyD family protein [Alkalidesulfovibrio alkalitolerans DSM 16529]|jgi:HlyD family secretion protein/macrolide-specific efflux system membrane fusion protein|uniref:Secretion protein HlyD family protein n=1 Tax=Alkalidesulfovibrio alkalitolerans DSM 16529 TaxID=1121439 RepID=S7UMG3_9BACT|nr:efflux RND transporter periplasmic adaptor subunit [Alkalidesulfovibrio alkalitolerans]EPR35144.1 secretion protein HlyD family protein [Alkalidesulfovibrio alkalitolerans DSM 16529]
MKKIIVIILVLAVLATGGYFVFGTGKSDQVQVLATATVQRGDVRKVLEATGIVKAMVGAEVKIGARTSGVIERMFVRVGDSVTRGDLIALIDAREEEAQRIEAEARLLRARAELNRVETVFPLQIRESEAALREAQAELEYAETNFSRQQRLVEQALQAQDELDRARQETLSSRNRVAARELTVNRLREEFAQERIKAQKAMLEAEANLETLAVRLSYKRIISPITGIVSQVTAQEGETVVSGLQVSNLITVIDPARLEMWIYVDETDVGLVKPGQDVEFSVDAQPGELFTGTVDRIYPQPEIRDNIVYYLAIVTLNEEQALRLRPDMTTQCKIVVEVRKDVLALPNNALKWVGDTQYVFVGGQGAAVRRVQPVLGLQGLEKSEVIEGLSEGDVVATQVVLPAAMLTRGGK